MMPTAIRDFLVTHGKLLKWSAMLAALAWTLIFQLGGASAIPEFVYVNF